MSVSDRAKEKRDLGNNLLIILATSGIGGILNAIVNLRAFSWESIEIGIWIDLGISFCLILSGVLLRRYFHSQATKIWSK